MNYAFLLLDAVIVAVLLFFFVRGRKKGLILTLCGLAAFFVAIIGARMLTETFSPTVADWLQPHFSVAFGEELGANLDEKLDELFPADEPGDSAIAKLLVSLGIYDEVTTAIRDAVSGPASQTAADAAATLARSVAEIVADILTFIVAFLLLLAVWYLISHALDLASRLPVINGLNRLLGGLFGLLQGMIILFLVAWLLRVLDVIPQEITAQTKLLKFFLTTDLTEFFTGI